MEIGNRKQTTESKEKREKKVTGHIQKIENR